MTEKFESLIKEIIEKGIPCVGFGNEGDSLSFEIGGFSKSGTAVLYEIAGNIYCRTRYNTIDEIETFEDVVDVAWEWNDNYITREPFTAYDRNWLPYFKAYGLVENK